MNRLFSRSIPLVIIMCVMSLVANAAGVSFTVDAPRQVVQGNQFQVRYILRNAEGSNFKAPNIEGADLRYGPATSSSYQWVNGNSSSSVTYTMTYVARKTGSLSVAPASIVVNGKAMHTSATSIQVLPPNKSTGGNSNGATNSRGVDFDNPDTQSAGKAVSSNDIFVRISMSKSSVYEQEAVVCTIKLYTKYQISQFMPTLQPSFDGFLIEDLPLSPSLNSIERVGGENYMTAELKRCILFPQKSGKLTITSGNYDVSVVQYEQVNTMFGVVRQPVEKHLMVKSNSATVNITPLPEPKPATFNGAVGRYSIKTSINPELLKTYEAATYKIEVTGEGNVKYLKAPTVNFPSQFDVYDPQTTPSASVKGSTLAGTMTFDYTFVPQYVGKYQIPSSVFTYFNPATRQYVNLNIPEYNVNVAKGSGSPAAAGKGLEQKNKDILHIKKGNLDLSKNHGFYIDSFGYWLVFLIPSLALVALLFYYRKSIKERSDMQKFRTKRAGKVAQKRLKVAKAFAAKGDNTNFYAELLNACWGYLSDKLGIPQSNLSKDTVATELADYGVGEELIDSTKALLDKCEFAQYAPELAKADLNSVLNEAAELMDKLENVKRKK